MSKCVKFSPKKEVPIRDKYRVVEMVNGDFRVQTLVDDSWELKDGVFYCSTAASALSKMEKCIEEDQELVDSQTVKKILSPEEGVIE